MAVRQESSHVEAQEGWGLWAQAVSQHMEAVGSPALVLTPSQRHLEHLPQATASWSHFPK